MLTEFLSGLARRGVTIIVEGERLAVRPSDRLTDADRDTLRRHRDELVAYLTGQAPEPWDQLVALHLMDQADAAVEESRVRGTHPEVRAAAHRATDAYYRHDLGGVRSGCAEVVMVVRRLRRSGDGDEDDRDRRATRPGFDPLS